MEILKHQKGENSTYEISGKISGPDFKAAVDKVFKRNQKQFSVPGFRKGKAPKHLIEKMYGKDAFYNDAINEIFPDHYENAVKELALEPVDRPNVDIESIDEAEGLTINITVVVKPEISVGEYKGLKATKADNTVTDDEINARVDEMRQRNSRLLERKGKAKKGDTTIINFEGFVDDVAFPGGKGDDFSLVLGSDQFIPGFEEQIIGHSAGDEFDVNVSFPEKYHATELAGKPALFKVKLNEVKYTELPEADDEFAKDVSEYNTMDELKDSIKSEIADRKEKEAATKVENELMDQIVAGVEGDIPSVMFENRVNDMVHDFEHRLQGQGLNVETYLKYLGQDMNGFRGGFEEEATRQVKTRLALEKIAELENIKATDEDLDKEIARIAEAYKMEADKVRELIPVEDVMKDLALNKTLDMIKESAKITAKKAPAKSAAKSAAKTATKAPAKKKKAVKEEAATDDKSAE